MSVNIRSYVMLTSRQMNTYINIDTSIYLTEAEEFIQRSIEFIAAKCLCAKHLTALQRFYLLIFKMSFKK